MGQPGLCAGFPGTMVCAGTGRLVLLGDTERLSYVDAPGHVEDLKRYRARGYAMAGNRVMIVTSPG